jgi:hypothetical protein
MTNAGRSPSTIPSDHDIEEVVLAIRAVDHKSAWERTLEVGRIVFEVILCGNEEEWRSRRSHKNVSLRKLVQHAKCPFKKSSLCSAVNIHLFVSAEPSVRKLPGITPTHVAQALTLERSRALALLVQAGEAGWSARELGQTVRSLRREAGERRGRPISSTDHKAEVAGRRAVMALAEMRERLNSCKSLGDDALRRVRATLQEVSDLVATIQKAPPLIRPSGVILMAKVVPADDTGAKTA